MAKIYHSLYDRMLYEKGLLQAFAKVKSNKGAPGVDGQGRIDRSRIRGPYVRFCERDEVGQVCCSPHPTRLLVL
jgi:hypothetical protein